MADEASAGPSAAAASGSPNGPRVQRNTISAVAGTMKLIRTRSVRFVILSLRRRAAVHRLSALASMGNPSLIRSSHYRGSRASSTRATSGEELEEDPLVVHAMLHNQQSAPNGGGRAWLVVFGYFLVCSSTLGLQYAYAAIFPALLVALGEGPTATALVGSLCAGMMEGFAVVTALSIARLGAQRTCQIGGLLAVVGLTLSAACDSVWQLCLTHGVVTGLGHSLAFFSPIVRDRPSSALIGPHRPSSALIGPHQPSSALISPLAVRRTSSSSRSLVAAAMRSDGDERSPAMKLAP